MIKLNRIGYKLGLAGALSVVLAVGMVANQMVTETHVAGSTERAGRSQRVADSSLAAHLDLRKMQLTAREVRLARTPPMSKRSSPTCNASRPPKPGNWRSRWRPPRTPETKERLAQDQILDGQFRGRRGRFGENPDHAAGADRQALGDLEGMEQGDRDPTGLAGAGQARQSRRDRKAAASGRCQGERAARHGLAARRHRRYQPDRRDRQDPGRAQDQFQPVARRGRRPRFADGDQLARSNRQAFPRRQ